MEIKNVLNASMSVHIITVLLLIVSAGLGSRSINLRVTGLESVATHVIMMCMGPRPLIPLPFTEKQTRS